MDLQFDDEDADISGTRCATSFVRRTGRNACVSNDARMEHGGKGFRAATGRWDKSCFFRTQGGGGMSVESPGRLVGGSYCGAGDATPAAVGWSTRRSSSGVGAPGRGQGSHGTSMLGTDVVFAGTAPKRVGIGCYRKNWPAAEEIWAQAPGRSAGSPAAGTLLSTERRRKSPPTAAGCSRPEDLEAHEHRRRQGV